MFSKFGIKEIFYGVKKYFLLVLAATILLGVFGFVTANPNNKPDDYYLFSSSKSYLIDIEESTSKEGSLRNEVMNNIYSSLSADFTKQYILDNLMKEFSAEEILHATDTLLSENEINYSVLNDKIKVSVLNESNIINFFSFVLDKKIAERITFYADEYFNNVLVLKFENIEGVTCLGGTDSQSPNKEAVETTPLSASKKAVIFAIIGFALSFISILVVVLIKPFVSRKDDYENYGTKVIFDASNFKKSFVSYGVEIISCATEKKNLCILNLAKSKSCINALNEITKQLIQKDNKLSVTVVDDVLNNFDSFLKVKENGAIIIVDRIGTTTHKRIENTLAILKDCQVDVIGTILL